MSKIQRKNTFFFVFPHERTFGEAKEPGKKEASQQNPNNMKRYFCGVIILF